MLKTQFTTDYLNNRYRGPALGAYCLAHQRKLEAFYHTAFTYDISHDEVNFAPHATTLHFKDWELDETYRQAIQLVRKSIENHHMKTFSFMKIADFTDLPVSTVVRVCVYLMKYQPNQFTPEINRMGACIAITVR